MLTCKTGLVLVLQKNLSGSNAFGASPPEVIFGCGGDHPDGVDTFDHNVFWPSTFSPMSAYFGK